MADYTEAKLFDNLDFLVGNIVPLGASYSPPNPHAQSAAMLANFTAALALRTTLQEKYAAETLARHDRSELHRPLSDLCKDLANYCKSAGWTQSDLSTLYSFSRELRGSPAGKREDDPNTPGNEAAGGRSPAQTSYPSRTEHFANFVETLRARGDFDPTEERFKLSALDALVQALRDANSNVNAAVVAVAQARAALDELLYLNDANLIEAAKSARFYLKSSFKEIFDSIKHMKFRKSKRLA